MNPNDKDRPMEMADFFDSVADMYEGHMLWRAFIYLIRLSSSRAS
jgi:hypothetical protein